MNVATHLPATEEGMQRRAHNRQCAVPTNGWQRCERPEQHTRVTLLPATSRLPDRGKFHVVGELPDASESSSETVVSRGETWFVQSIATTLANPCRSPPDSDRHFSSLMLDAGDRSPRTLPTAYHQNSVRITGAGHAPRQLRRGCVGPDKCGHVPSYPDAAREWDIPGGNRR